MKDMHGGRVHEGHRLREELRCARGAHRRSRRRWHRAGRICVKNLLWKLQEECSRSCAMEAWTHGGMQACRHATHGRSRRRANNISMGPTRAAGRQQAGQQRSAEEGFSYPRLVNG